MFYKTAREIIRAFFYIFFGKPKVFGKENIIEAKNGAVIVCSNHTSNWDPFILAFIFPRQLFFMAKEALFKNKLLAKMLHWAGAFPVDRDGKDISAVKQALKVLKSGDTLGIFPEGKRYFDGAVHEFKEGTAVIAHKTKAKVVPVGFKRRVGLFKRPIAEIGKPIDFSKFYDKKGDAAVYKDMNDILQKEISRLASNGED